MMSKYISTHFSKSLKSNEWKAMRKLCPHPKIPALQAPEIDDYVKELVGNVLPKTLDKEIKKIQGAIVAAADPLVLLWNQLLKGPVCDVL
eukprot:m.221933 g.221933  ORF g.221933 m.221933 type:complete len:90 (+) comp39967_c0_seq2:453-722(+)